MAKKTYSHAHDAIAAGYAITSRKHCMASRIDRKDWKEHMAKEHMPWNPKDGMKWVEHLGPRNAADHYRRVCTTDNITVPASWVSQMPNSGDGPTEFKEA